ncbi:MAG: polysaccharide deacetylase family protein [Bacteroidota bacterium]|nr:polysaccharide deacetylase family protein [Bacteroidota bacterium]
MNFYSVNPIFQKILSNNTWVTNNNKILLTFDDGPVPGNTDKILNWLSDRKIKALFFCVGNNVKNNFSITKNILSEGHTIGNHTYNHKVLYNLNETETKRELTKFNDLLKDEHNYEVKYFRPPHGRLIFNMNKTLKKYNMNCIMWSLITYDFNNDINIVKFAIEKKIRKNSIIVLHDSLKSKDIIIDSLNFFYEILEKKGYEIGDPEKCLK